MLHIILTGGLGVAHQPVKKNLPLIFPCILNFWVTWQNVSPPIPPCLFGPGSSLPQTSLSPSPHAANRKTCLLAQPAIFLRARQQHSPDQAVSLPACSYSCSPSWWGGGGLLYGEGWINPLTSCRCPVVPDPPTPCLACRIGEGGVAEGWRCAAPMESRASKYLLQKELITVLTTPPLPEESRVANSWQTFLASSAGNSAAEEKIRPASNFHFFKGIDALEWKQY